MTNILDPDYESDLTEEEHNQLVLMSEHAIAPPLSPAAQAVLCAFRTSHTGPASPAAALRAAVNEVAPEKTIEDIDYVHQSYVDGYKDALFEILILANELEVQ